MIRINDLTSKATLKAAAVLGALLLFAAVATFGQQQINLTAGFNTTTMPDGTVLPMWGYSCGTAVTTPSTATCVPLSAAGALSPAAMGELGGIYVLNGGSGYTSATTVTISAPTGVIPGVTNATATASAVVSSTGVVLGINLLSPGAGYIAPPTITLSGGTGAVAAAGPAWSPVLITVPTGTVAAPAGLTINLTNNLSFTPAAGGTANSIPTSIVIVGQVGGGLGLAPTTTTSPTHTNMQGCVTWFIASGVTPPGTPCPGPQSGASGTPPSQGPRVQSMGTEVAAVAPGAVTATALTWAALKPGTYLLESGTHPSIQVPMGLIGVLVVTTAPTSGATATAGTAYPAGAATATTAATPAVTYGAEVPLEFSEIDPVQNKAVDAAVRTAGFSETKVWSGMVTDPNTGMPGCGNPASSTYNTCYPPAVNYTPFYYLINGAAFNKTLPLQSVFAATAGTSTTTNATTGATTTTPVTTGITGTVLVRLVNAGLRMHTPSILNSLTQGFTGAGASATVAGFTLIAEDGNVLPNVAPPGAATAPAAPRVQTDVLMVPSKVYDALVNVPTAAASGATPAIPIFARDLALSANSSVRDAGMLAYISVNNASAGSALPVTAGTGVFAGATANPDNYKSVVACAVATPQPPCSPLVVSDVSKGVIANDVNVYGVALATPPTSGTLTCTSLGTGLCANGTFTYTPNPGFTTTSSDSFGYCANGAAPGTAGLCTTVTLGASSLVGNPVANPITFTSKLATFLKIPSPGVLSVDTDPNNLPLQVVLSSVTPSGVTINMDPNGGFTASAATAGSYSFTYTAQNSQGRQSNSATVTLVFPQPSNLTVKVLDAQLFNNCNGNSACINGLTAIGDYRWIIEEDKTFYIDPNCTTNASITTAGCPNAVGSGGTIPVFGVQFHTSNMDFVAQGCTGPLSCEGGQTFLNPATGTHDPAVCDVGNGACRVDPTGGNGFTPVLPSQVALDPSKRYYISVLPGDAANPFPAYLGQPVCSSTGGTSTTQQCGHTMSGAPVPAACNILGGPNACPTIAGATPPPFAPVNVLVLPTPLPTGNLSLIVFEDDFPLNGEQDGGGGNGTVAPIEPGLGGFNIVLWDTYGGLGDVTGQDTYDTFNQPLSNSLVGTIDPSTGNDACPASSQVSANSALATGSTTLGGDGTPVGTQKGIQGMIVTCPKYESDGQTLSPLAGQAVIANLMPDKFSVQAYPGADRIARGEEWLQTNTLDGQHPHDSFIRIGEPTYFQEYGPAGYHVAIGFANPALINARAKDVCAGAGSPGAVGPCSNTIDGQVNIQRLSRIPDERLYPSGSHDALAWTQCWVSLGDPDGEDFMFTKCDANGNFKFTGVPGGNWRLTIGDQWNDQIIDGLSTPANVGCVPVAPASTCSGGLSTLHMGNVGIQQWQSNVYTTTFIDDNKNGIKDPGEIGIPLIYTRIYYRDGHNANSLTTDFNGVASFNETFPLFNWYVVEADSTRYKTTGIHTVYDAGGPADGTTCGTSTRPCGTSTAYNFMANTFESVPLPSDLSVPGAVYCAKADCASEAAGFAAGTPKPSSSSASTGRLDPPWVTTEGWAGLTGQSNWIEFGKAPYAACPPACVTVPNAVSNPSSGGTTASTTQVGENGGIQGFVAYVSTRPFDDASQMIQQPWEPNIPHVTVNLLQEGFAADGVTPTLTLVDTTQSSSWDDWAQGFYPNSTAGGTGLKPYMSCPGQGTNVAGSPNQDLFYFTLFDQPNYLDWYNSIHSAGASPLHPLPYNSQFKCYDSMKINNQIQPAPYDGKYSFPSSLGVDPTTGKLLAVNGSTNGVASSLPGTNCTICVKNPDTTDVYRVGTPMLPPGKYVVQVMMPPGFEVYKEEDKNLLIGDNLIAPVTQQFAGLGTDIFIMPDQASIASLYDQSGAGFNPTNYQDATTGLGLADELSGVPGFPGFQDPVWPCVGEMRVVPDYLSLFPRNQEVAPFAGATRPLCDRKEVTLANQMSVRAHFSLFTSTHIAAKYTGVITDDMTSEFDPFSPQFGEKFAPPNMPISTKDYLGNELSRVYSDHWGVYDGLTFSSWDVNPPNITGYSPSMQTQCMNDPGPILDTRIGSPTIGQLITDPLYNPAYSDFCYEQPYMPGLTVYGDTPVVPTQAFVGAAYNNADCSYPDATPAIKEVDGDGIGPWVSKAGNTLTITALGDQQESNSAYAGPSAMVAPFNMKTVTRHYGFGGQCLSPTAGSTTCSKLSSVTIGGIPATIGSWSDTQIQVTVPSGVPNCAVQQQAQYGGSTAQCGQLVINAGNGKQSIDTVSVTIGGKSPTHISATASIQSAIDAADPGDLLIVDPTCMSTGTTPTAAACSSSAINAATPTQTASVGSHNEILIMWKPVRLQGVGATSSIVNANTFPSGKLLNPWRRHINCLFGLSLAGVPTTTTGGAGSYDSTGTYSCPDAGWNPSTWSGAPNNPQIDRLPLEATVGWDATQNGNLAEQLQEPALMGAYEGAGITVLGKGVDFHGANPWSDGNEGGAFPASTTLLTGVGPDPTALPVGDANALCHNSNSDATNPFPSNFTCNPSSIDGLSIINSSQGGGGIFAHGWAHHLQIANNRIYNNAGTLTGGISVGQGEFPTPYVQGGTANAAPGSCSDGTGWVNNQHLPYCLQLEVNVHNNAITSNSSLGDELFSGTLSGGGGATFCTGNDYYKFNYNWVCGNVSSGEGGGLVHLGEIQFGDIEHNSIVLNQSNNPTIPTNGGGIQIMGTPDTDPVCGTQIDADCPPGLSDGTGHGLVINANLIQANMAESGSGGGIRLQQVNGTDVSTFPGIYAITAADEAHTVRITVPATATLPAVGDSVTIAGVSVAGYNGTFTVNGVGTRLFTYLDGTTGLGTGTGGTFTDTTTAGTAQTIANARQVGGGVVTITSTLSPSVGDTVVITGVTPGGYNGTYIVTEVPTVGSFTYTDPRNLLTAGTGGTVTDSSQTTAALWNGVSLTNNIIVNNVAGWDGGGISLQDSLNVSIVNNTIAKNDTLASSGVLTQSLGTPDASAPAGSCHNAAGTTSCPQSAGVTSTQNSTLMTTSLTGLTLICPHGKTNCAGFSNPVLLNDLIWQNRAFQIGITGPGTGNGNQQNLVALFNAAGAAVPSQTSTGACNSNDTYWDLGVRGDTGPTNHGSGFTLTAQNTLITTTGAGSQPRFISSYCNGSRVPVECTVADGCGGPSGYGVPPGIADALTPNPVFTLTPAATVDEGNNWINVSWGPLSLSNDALTGPDGNYGGGVPLGNYGLDPNSGAIDRISAGETVPAGVRVPATDFFGNPRPNPDGDRTIDYGAVETQTNVTSVSPTLTLISPNTGLRGTAVQVTFTGTHLTGTTAINVSGTLVTVSDIGVVSDTSVVATFTIAATAATTARNVSLVTSAGTTNTLPFTVTAAAPTLSAISPTSGVIGATAIPVTITGTNLNGATAITISGTGVSHGAITVNAAGTQITTTFTITRTAAVGARTVTVTTPGGVTNPETFTVESATLTFSAPTPALTTGTANTTTKTATITVTNTATGANAGPFTFTANPTITGTGFSILTGGTCVSGFALNSGGSTCTIDVQYAPGTSTALRSGHVTVAGTGIPTATQNSATFQGN